MNLQAELEALQNATMDLGLIVHINHFDYCRKKPKFYVQLGIESISPVLDYDKMNHFLLGYRRAIEISKRPKLNF
jgi:hypothetical protein